MLFSLISSLTSIPYIHTFTITMDDSWKMRIGTTTTTTTTAAATAPKQSNNLRDYETLDPNDFDDVFGGPPRTVISRQYSANSFVFEDMFRKPNMMLPEFRIPETKTAVAGQRVREEEFYSDIFGNSRRSRSRSVSQTNSKSKSNSSSILSSEELSPFRPAVVDDDDDDGGGSFSSFAAKLRPINVASKWNTSKKMHEAQQMTNSPCNFDSFESDYTHKFKGCYSGFSQRGSSPDITTFRAYSYTSVKESTEDLQVNSPGSIVSSQDDETATIHEKDDDDEVMSSFVIEINPSKVSEKSGESHGVDEAIAWAKQKCKARNLEKDCNTREDDDHQCPAVEETPGVNSVPEAQNDRHGSRESPSLDKPKVWKTEESFQDLEKDVSPCKQMELELLDEDVKLWSDGKERNIRLLLSTLHHILWPSSGWIMIPLTNLKDNSNVKKAYQKARLCLHPDKLQQRGATLAQKYVAEKAFPILQDAWAAFISQDVCSSIK
ncbi:hypothetical protein QVD17_21900 [Tagetes erecta]|uniref:Uncharacterized protein n=1 Tax=Tagetes erecta TaxID=13708 RepID=A0AAD8KCG1_TARER|nr:hypothetical protein QVD17_21900 [Tagetes erecta]